MILDRKAESVTLVASFLLCESISNIPRPAGSTVTQLKLFPESVFFKKNSEAINRSMTFF
jgi:hypothetical protein